MDKNVEHGEGAIQVNQHIQTFFLTYHRKKEEKRSHRGQRNRSPIQLGLNSIFSGFVADIRLIVVENDVPKLRRSFSLARIV